MTNVLSRRLAAVFMVAAASATVASCASTKEELDRHATLEKGVVPPDVKQKIATHVYLRFSKAKPYVIEQASICPPEKRYWPTLLGVIDYATCYFVSARPQTPEEGFFAAGPVKLCRRVNFSKGQIVSDDVMAPSMCEEAKESLFPLFPKAEEETRVPREAASKTLGETLHPPVYTRGR